MKGALLLILILVVCGGTVRATIAGCLVYGAPANGKEVCSKCEDYRVATFVGDVCLDCPAGCVECDIAKKCLRCRDSLYLVAATGECKACGNNCAKCDGPLCAKCAMGHFVDSSRSFCVRCNENCVECQNASVCTKCLEKYEVTDQNSNRVCKLKITTSDILILSTLGFLVCCCPIICICFFCAACNDKSGHNSDPVIIGNNNNRNNYQPLTPMQPGPGPAPYIPPYNQGYNQTGFNAGYNTNMGYGYGGPAYNQFNAGY